MIQVYGFVGPSGTGKSHRATEVAKSNGIEYIIDDGIYIRFNQVVSGKSAKMAKTKVGSLKRAVFFEDDHCEMVRAAIRKTKPEKILILGTSDKMVRVIAERLGLPAVSKTIYIDDVASKSEQRIAKYTRMNKGTHVVPVATFEIKRDFSGVLLDPINWMTWKGRTISNYEKERSVVRPTFSMLGNYTISDFVIQQLIKKMIKDHIEIQRVKSVIINQVPDGIQVNVEVVMFYGAYMKQTLRQIQEKVVEDLENITALFVTELNIRIAGLTKRA